MDHESQAALGVLIVFGFIVIFLLMLFDSGSSKKVRKDPVENIRRIGQETREVMSKTQDDYVIQELMFLSGEKGRRVLSGKQSPTASETVSCPNSACDAYGQTQNESSRPNIVKYGKTPAGSQRYRCKTCGKTFRGS